MNNDMDSILGQEVVGMRQGRKYDGIQIRILSEYWYWVFQILYEIIRIMVRKKVLYKIGIVCISIKKYLVFGISKNRM